MTVRERIINALVQMEISYYGDTKGNKLDDETDIFQYLEAGNFDVVDLSQALETEFEITVYQGDLATITTFADLVRYMEGKL